MHVSYCDAYVCFCVVPPTLPEYGKTCPVYTFYRDGSWSRVYQNNHYRTPANTLRKSYKDYSFAELEAIVKEFDNCLFTGKVSKEFAQSIKDDILKRFKAQIDGMVEFQAHVLLSALAEYWDDEESDNQWRKMLNGLEKANKILGE